MTEHGSRRIRRLALVMFGLVALIYLLGPPIWMIRSSFMPDAELRIVPPHLFPDSPTLDYYRALFQIGDDGGLLDRNINLKDFLKAARNSFVVATTTTVIATLLGAVFAYSISRFIAERPRKWLLLLLLLLRMLPLISVLVPIYLLLLLVNLLDTLQGLILVYTGLLLPFAIWILEGFFRNLPRDLEEAAMIDGATQFQTFTRVVLPISWNGLFAAGAFVFVSTWSDFVVGFIMTTTDRAYPISIVIARSMTPWREPEWGLLNASGLIAALVPVLIAFLLRRLVSGERFAGATKG